MALRLGLLAGWLVVVGVPVGVWWWRGRTTVDPWRHLPVAAAVLAPDGRIVSRAGPPGPRDWPVDGLPPAGVSTRAAAPDGTPVALTGVDGGVVAVAVEADPGLARRHGRLTALVPLLQHEVRGGLQAVLGHVTLVAEDGALAGSADAARSLAVIRREVGRLLDLVDGAEVLARVTGQQPPRDDVHVSDLVAEAAAGYPGVGVEVPGTAVRVSVVTWQVVRVLRNLIDNALRHGGEPVRVVAQVVGEEVELRICDAGPGLAPVDLERLAAPFVRGSGDSPGQGLGLAVAAEVLAAHGSALATGQVDGRPAVGFRLPVLPA